MANFYVPAPWANSATRRPPTVSERNGGFECGPADKQLFDYLIYSLHAELGHLIDYAGLTGTDADTQQVRKAIELLIAAALGSGTAGDYLLMAQARSRLPFWPEVQSSDNKINVIQPTGGQVQVPSGVTVLHRGIYPISTSDFTEGERTFSTDPSKVYHLRLNLGVGVEALSLEDLADTGYNAGGDPETDSMFDSAYDDMLVARVVTDGSNVATITNLRNAIRLSHRYASEAAALNAITTAKTFAGTGQTLNWARTPIIYDPKLRGLNTGSGTFATGYVGTYGLFGTFAFAEPTVTRYGSSDLQYFYDDSHEPPNDGRVAWSQDFLAV